RKQPALPEVAGRAGCNDVVPGSGTAAAAGNDVVEGQLVMRAAILALEAVTQEHIEPREGRVSGRLDVAFQRDDAGQLHLEGRRRDRVFIFGDDVDAVEEHRLDRVLPGPQRQGVVA